MQTLQTQQRMSDDISDIRATLKEAAQIVTHLNRDVSDMRSRLEKVERHPMECQAATRIKNKREFIEATLPRIECRHNWAIEYKECEKLLLEQLSLDEALRSLWADVVKGLENG
jgi:hypoxanthine phosphoribosyltransferase